MEIREMKKKKRRGKMFKSIVRKFAVILAGLMVIFSSQAAFAESAKSLERRTDAALKNLYEAVPSARKLSGKAKGILVFPSIVKGGFIFGAQYGTGTLRKGKNTAGYYKTTAVSYGLQAGAQQFGYALFFMSDKDLDYLNRSGGWEIGVGPSITIVDEGLARSLTTTTAKKGVYAFFFGQKGLMAGLGLQGSRIKRIYLD
jgi:lipid-binding SYLF domain-containing protein